MTKHLLCAALLLVLAGGGAAAQDAAETGAAPIKFGPLSLTPKVRLSNLGIDTNVFDTTEDKKKDFTATVTPQLDASLDFSRLRVRADAGADFIYFYKFDQERSIDPSFGGQTELRLFTRSAVFVQYGQTQVRDRVNFEIDRRVRRREKTGGAGIRLGVTRRLLFEAAASRGEIRFADDATFHGVQLRETLDRDVEAIDGSMQYQMTSLTTAQLSMHVGQDNFILAPSRNATTTEVLVGGTFKPRALLAGRANVGFTHSAAASPTVPNFTGAIANVDLTYTLLEATQLEFAFERSKGYSFEPAYPYYRLNRYLWLVRRHLIRRVDGGVSTELQNRAYAFDRSLLGLVQPDGRPDVAWRYGAQIGTQLTRRARVAVQAEYTTQERGRVERVRYDGLRVGFTASYGLFSVGERVAPVR